MKESPRLTPALNLTLTRLSVVKSKSEFALDVSCKCRFAHTPYSRHALPLPLVGID